MSRVWSGRPEQPPPPSITCPCACHGHSALDRRCNLDGGCGHLHRSVSTRCLLDDRQPGRPVDGPRSQVCAAHRARLQELLDPDQHGQMYAKPDERRIPASIPVLYGLLPVERGRTGEHVGGAGGVFRSTPPADLTAMVHRDPRSTIGTGRDDHDRDGHLSALGTLATIALRLDLRDLDGRAVRWPLDPVRLAAWLHARLDQLCGVDWIGDAWHDLRALHSQLRSAAGDPAPRPLGPCQKLVDDDGRLQDDGPWKCGVPLYLPPQPLKGMDQPVHLPTVLTCTACGGVYSRVDIVRLGRERGQQVPA